MKTQAPHQNLLQILKPQVDNRRAPPTHQLSKLMKTRFKKLPLTLQPPQRKLQILLRMRMKLLLKIITTALLALRPVLDQVNPHVSKSLIFNHNKPYLLNL